MPKKIFNDYNNILEGILDHKSFTAEVKNLLLSTLYKIETNYKDYETVKKEVIAKNMFIQNIIKVINLNCEKITLVEPTSKKEKHVTVVKDNTIITSPTEYDLFTGILELAEKKFYIEKKYELVEKSLKKVLEIGYIENSKEVLNNFDGWNWYVQNIKTEYAIYNLIYQNLQLILGVGFLEEWKNDSKEETDYIKKAKEIIANYFGGELQKELEDAYKKVMYKIEILEFPEFVEKQLKQFKEYKKEYTKLLNTTKYVSDVSKQKQEINKAINELDKILFDKDLLQQEYEKRNEDLAFDKKIFNIKHLINLLKEERNELVLQIRELNKKIEPNMYLKNKGVLQEKVEQYNGLYCVFEENKELLEYVMEVQKIFLKLLEKKVEKSVTKKEMINLIYILRYYKNIKVEENKSIKDYDELINAILTVERTLILKAYNSGVFLKLTENTLYLVDIISKIFDIKIINLEDIYILPNVQEKKQYLEIYDGEILEKKLPLEKEIKLVEFKKNKKIKLFI